MDELGFRACKECGQRALIELDAGNGRVCARYRILAGLRRKWIRLRRTMNPAV
jgi:hypothetical protein